MLDSIPAPWRATLWPLLGAAIILTVGYLLPTWLRRLLAAAAAAASLTGLWSLVGGTPDSAGWSWEPITFFRAGPALQPQPLSLFVGITLAGTTTAVLPGIRGAARTAWHGLMLVALAGCLITAMAANLLTLALGSALLDLALLAMAASAAGEAGRIAWRMAVPGVASTLLLFSGAILMNTQAGTTFLSARLFPMGVLLPLGLAGLARLMAFPLHPRGLATAENAATLVLPTGAGACLLARVQSLAPTLADRPWVLAVGGAALLAGGALAWIGGARDPDRAGTGSAPWFGLAVHQVGLTLLFILLLDGLAPWPLVSLALAVGMTAIWWDSSLAQEPALRPGWLQAIGQRLASGAGWVQGRVATAVPALERWRNPLPRLRPGWVGQRLLPALALASPAGAPFTAGAISRWSLYGRLLAQGQGTLLLGLLLADTLLAAGLWAALRALVRQRADRPVNPLATLALLALVVATLAVGVSPGRLGSPLGLEPPPRAGVSAWGLGLLYGLPWLLGLWLAYAGGRLARPPDPIRSALNLDWLYRAASWAGQRLVDGLYWLSRVGEGDGWWGWALILLALGAIFLTAR